ETVLLPAHVKRLNGTQLPVRLGVRAQSHEESTWAASFAHSPEQAISLARKGDSRGMYWRNAHEWQQSNPIDLTLHEEAEKVVAERTRAYEGRVSSRFDFYGDDDRNATELDPTLDEQDVILNLTVPHHLMPTSNRTFVSIVSYLQISLKTQVKPNASMSASPYPLLSDLEDDEAWSSHPYRHIEKLADRLLTGQAAVGTSRSGDLDLHANVTVTIVPGESGNPPRRSSSGSNVALPLPVSYLSRAARAPVVLPITPVPPVLADVEFPLMNHEQVIEEAGRDGTHLVKSKYNRLPWRRSGSQVAGGAYELAGQLWQRKLARDKEYAVLAAVDDSERVDPEAQRRLVVQQ
ncbi:hypothetical protein JCM10212_006229, partial [Sporobolomyces blumeae]